MYIRSFSDELGLCTFLSVTSGVQNTAAAAVKHNTVMQLCTKLALSLLFVLCFTLICFVQNKALLAFYSSPQ